MKLSSIIAVILSAALPTSAFSQNYAASRSLVPIPSARAGAAAAVQIVPGGPGAVAPLTLSASLSAPLAPAPGTTIAPMSAAVGMPLLAAAVAVPASSPRIPRSSSRPTAAATPAAPGVGAVHELAHGLEGDLPGLYDGRKKTAAADTTAPENRSQIATPLSKAAGIADAKPVGAPAPETPKPASSLWQKATKSMVLSSGVIFSVMQFPQILKNYENLAAGHLSDLAILPWAGYSSGILANMMLLAYFRCLGEKATAGAQIMGVLTSSVVLVQIFMAGFMPLPALAAVMSGISLGFAFNWLHQKKKISDNLWDRWSRATSLLGVGVLAQNVWLAAAQLAAPALSGTILPLVVGIAVAVLIDYYVRHTARAPKWLSQFWNAVGAWTATALFGYGAVIGHVYTFLNPQGLRGLSLISMFLGLAGNMLLLPRMMLTKNTIGTVGNAWAVGVGALGTLTWMVHYGFISPLLFWATMIAVPALLYAAHRMNRKFPQHY